MRWFHLTHELFAKWNSTYHSDVAEVQDVNPTATVHTPATQIDSSSQKQLETYARTIQHDETAYKPFKDE